MSTQTTGAQCLSSSSRCGALHIFNLTLGTGSATTILPSATLVPPLFVQVSGLKLRLAIPDTGGSCQLGPVSHIKHHP